MASWGLGSHIDEPAHPLYSASTLFQTHNSGMSITLVARASICGERTARRRMLAFVILWRLSRSTLRPCRLGAPPMPVYTGGSAYVGKLLVYVKCGVLTTQVRREYQAYRRHHLVGD